MQYRSFHAGSEKKISHCVSIEPRRCHWLLLIVRKPSDEKLLRTILLHFVLNLIQVKIWPPTEKNTRKRKSWWHCYGRKCIINFALPSNVTAAGMHEFFSGKGQSWKKPRNRNGPQRKAIISVVHKHDVFPEKTNFLESSNFKKHIGKGERKTILLVL
jgi:hypothetical protein